jgi:alkylation response protein AidB-like acyl-CoA dehydrogenase
VNFDLSDEQQLLKDSVDRFVSDNYDLDTRQKLSKNEAGFSDTYWQTMAELGWLGVTIPEAHGGFGGTQADTMVLMEAFGKGLVLEPFFCQRGTWNPGDRWRRQHRASDQIAAGADVGHLPAQPGLRRGAVAL